MNKRLKIGMMILGIAAVCMACVVSAEESTAKETVVMYINSSRIQVDGKERMLDESDRTAVPVQIEEQIYIPLSAGKKIWAGKMDTLKTLLLNEKPYIKVRDVADLMSLHLQEADGLVILSNREISMDADQLRALYLSLSALPAVESRDRLEALLKVEWHSYPTTVGARAVFVESDLIEASAGMDSYDAAAPALTGSVGAPDYSDTNIQVQGVDEGDIVKTDGEYIYYSDGKKITILRAYPPEKMEVLSVIPCEKGNIKELYVDGDQLVAVIFGYTWDSRDSDVIPLDDGDRPETRAEVYILRDRTRPELVKTVSVSGYYGSSRRIGSNLYLIASDRVHSYYGNRGMLLPMWSDSVLGAVEEIALDRMYYFPESVHSTFTNIAGIQLDRLDQPADVSTYLGRGDEYFVSKNHLYMTTSSSWYSSGSRYIDQTNIYQFELQDGTVKYTARGQVDGRVLNQFSMDEHDGYFRIATTSTSSGGGRSSSTASHLYVLNQNLNLAGQINGIAPGEQIYSVRFMGDRAYMVTFKTVDPLFVIDLKDPRAPKILGELKIPGYSDYLHPYDENHLIGIGMDTVEQDQMAYQQGMKVSLFDVSDVENPKEKFTALIGDRGTTSEALKNHRAFLFAKEKALLAFPIEVCMIQNKSRRTDVFSYGELTFQGAYVYHLDLEQGFQLKGQITHLPANRIDDYNAFISRILYIGDTLYTLSNAEIAATDLNTMTKVGSVEIR